MGLLRGLLALGATIVIAVFAALNRADVSVILNPLDLEQNVAVPLYLVVLSAVLFGFVTGALMIWLNMSPLRKQKRTQRKEIKELEKEMSKIKNDKFKVPASSEPTGVLPVLTSQ